MPDSDDQTAARIDQINADLVVCREAIQAVGVGGQQAVISATKYMEDVEFLMALLVGAQPQPAPKSELETALEHDAAGRTERRLP